MEEKKLFLLDAYALIYRAYYALMRTPRVTSSGINTSAVFGFCLALEDVLRKENPGYIAVCFDPEHGHTFRHDEYPEYKAGRDKQPEDITVAIPYIKRILKAFRIPVIEVKGYEADDVIGTLATKASEEGFTTYMMTPDKDYGQLVSDSIFMYRPALKGQGFEIRGPQQVCERYGISSPKQVIDLLALEGDASDNVPGCPGVGEKTAVKLIAQFGSVENMLENTDQIKGALQTKIRDNAEQIRMSKHLVTIVTDAPVDFDADELRRHEPDTEALMDVFRELEFKSFITKYGGTIAKSEPTPAPKPPKSGQLSLFDFDEPSDNPSASASAPLQKSDWTATELTSKSEIETFVIRALGAENVAIALNCEGAEAMTAHAYGLAVAFASPGATFEAAYIPFPAERTALSDIADRKSVV